jgi:hypothetical protein
MDRTVQPVPDRTMPYHGPVERWVGSPFTRKWTVPTRPVRTHRPDRTDREPCGTVDRTVPKNSYLKIDKFIFELLLFFIIF